jgi:hypothetical protein
MKRLAKETPAADLPDDLSVAVNRHPGGPGREGMGAEGELVRGSGEEGRREKIESMFMIINVETRKKED